MRCAIASLMLVVGVWVCPETAWGQSGKNGPAVPPQQGSNSGKHPKSAISPKVGNVKSTKSGVSLPVKGDPFSGSGLPMHSGTNAVFRWIQDGEFQMGSTEATDPDRDDNETPHKVTLRQGFWLLDHEVTQQEFQTIMGYNHSEFKGDPSLPVEVVSWNEADEFCRKLTESDRKAGRIFQNQRYRLPTEAEWEYACRAGTTTAVYYNVGDRNKELDAIAWWNWNSNKQTHPIKQKLPNAFGLYDMIGNVQEWCSDWYGGYPSGDVTDPKGRKSGDRRVVRGGGFGSVAENVRSASRNRSGPDTRYRFLGFRAALSSEF
jgi:formylglycine-generating enzyme required for sulfatase activity